jgi:hypothetical protein
VFTYIEELNDTARSIYPAELKAKYVVSAKELGRYAALSCSCIFLKKLF